MTTLRLLSWNVNGLRAVYKKGFLDWIRGENADVVCLQETKSTVDQLPADLSPIEGYHAFFSSAERKGYSGVALYSKRKPRRVTPGFGLKKFDREGRTLAADYGNFTLFNVYFPNGKASTERLRYKMEFYRTFLKHVSRLQEKGTRVVICGDVNTAHKEIDLARPKENEKVSGFLPEERAWIDELLRHGFVDTFRMFTAGPGHYTWWDFKSRARERNVGWRIDYFFISENLRTQVKSATILPDILGSDHCPVGLEVVA